MKEKVSLVSENQEIKPDIESIIRDVLHQWWVILLIALAAAMFFGAWSKLTYQPEYTAAATFVVGKSGFSNNAAASNLSSAEKMTEKFSQITDSNILKKRVCSELGLDSFDAQVNVSAVEKSNLMTLTVTAGNPRKAYMMIHAVIEGVTELSSELMDNIAVRMLQEPMVPVSVSNPPDVITGMKKAAMAAVAVMILFFAVVSYSKDTVKNEDEVSKKIDAKLLGTIYREKKFKTMESAHQKKQYPLTIDNPGLSFRYTESVRMMATRVRRELDKKGCKTLIVTSVSENEGKSTVAANLALALKGEGCKVLLVDCDFRKPSLYKIFELPENVQKEHDFGTAIKRGEFMEPYKAGLEKKLDVFFTVKPQNRMMNQSAVANLKAMLERMKKDADYIIIDSSPMALVSGNEIIAGIADVSLLVVRQDVVEARYINDTIDRLNAAGSKVIGCVYNNVQSGIFGKMRESGHYYGGYGYGAYSRYGHYAKRSKQSGRREE